MPARAKLRKLFHSVLQAASHALHACARALLRNVTPGRGKKLRLVVKEQSYIWRRLVQPG